MTTSRASLVPALRIHSSRPPEQRISFLPPESVTQVRISIAPQGPLYSTLPPPVRAAKMLKTVRKVAARLARRLPRHVDIEDLVGAGALGLADAFSRRNGMRGSEFEAFASYRVRGAMLDELRRLDALPRRSRTQAREVVRAQRAVEQRCGGAAKEEDVAKELGLELPAYLALRSKLEASRGPIALRGPANDDDDSVHDVADPHAELPDVIAARSQIGALVIEGINTLPDRMRRVLVGLYVEGETLKQIGETLGVSESRVCQIHTEALGILRARLEGGDDDAPASGVRARNVVAIRPQVEAPAGRRRHA